MLPRSVPNSCGNRWREVVSSSRRFARRGVLGEWRRKNRFRGATMPTTMEQDIVATPQLAAQWARVRGRLQQEFGEVEYRNWLRQMTLVGLDGDEITIHLPT